MSPIAPGRIAGAASMDAEAPDLRHPLARCLRGKRGCLIALYAERHHGVVLTVAEHERIRETEDRSWTLALLEQVRSPSTVEAERSEAFRTLVYLEDHRSIGPLTEMVEDVGVPEQAREAASVVVRGFDDTTTPRRRRTWWESGDRVLMAHGLSLMTRSEADIITLVAGDDRHPLQAVALDALAFRFDEPEYQQLKTRALRHPKAEVRATVADGLMWDEPVAAESALVRAASDLSIDVATAALNTLRYYSSRQVLRTLAERRGALGEQVRAKAVESFDDLQGTFVYAATESDRAEVELIRAWMEPIRDLVPWSDERPPQEAPPCRIRRPRVAVPEKELLALLDDSDGEWAAKKGTLRTVAWDDYASEERARLATVLSGHPDPEVRSIAAVPLAAWSKIEELLVLARDPSFSVRKSAIYSLGQAPRDPALAEPAWTYLTDAGGTTASEALQTYVTHADPTEARKRLANLAQTDRREGVLTTAIHSLVELAAAPEIETLLPLLREPPGVTWAVHIQLLDALRKLRLPAPQLDDLASVDNLYLVRSVVALRCSKV